VNKYFHHSPAQLIALLQEARRRTDLPQEVHGRLEALLTYAQSGSVSGTCRKFGVSRQTFYRWLRRFDAHDLQSLADKPKFFAKPPLVSTAALPVPSAVEARRWMAWKPALLAVSLALNVLIIGIGIGFVLGGRINTQSQPASLIEVQPHTTTGSIIPSPSLPQPRL